MNKFGNVMSEINKQLALRTNAHPNLSKVKGELPYAGKDIPNWILIFGFILTLTGLPAIVLGLYFSESRVYHNKSKVKKYHKNSRKYAEIISAMGFIVLIVQLFYWLTH